MLRLLIDKFPRQLASPQRLLIPTESEFIEKINKYNGQKNLYYSVYAPNTMNNFSTVEINKIFFDFDEENAIDDVIKLHEFLMKDDIQHLLIYSGKKGFHVYVFTVKSQLKNPKGALKNAHEYFVKTLNIKLDQHIIGDVARVARIPNTFHITGDKFCIPILKGDLYEGIVHIKQKAKEQQNKYTVYGSKLFDISPFDCDIKVENRIKLDTDFSYQIKFNEKIIKKFPLCVQQWLETPEEFAGIHNKCRYWFAVACREMCLPPTLCDEMAKYYWQKSKSRYRDFVTEHQVKYAYEKGDIFPNCDKLLKDKLCLKQCENYRRHGLHK